MIGMPGETPEMTRETVDSLDLELDFAKYPLRFLFWIQTFR